MEFLRSFPRRRFVGKFLVVWRNVWLFSEASFISLSEERKSCSLASWLNPNAKSLKYNFKQKRTSTKEYSFPKKF